MHSTAMLVRTYTQFTQVQRYQISALKKMEHTQSEIAQVLEVNRSTVSHELRRNTGGRGYRPKQADEKAMSRRPKAKPRIETDEWKVVEEKLCQDWSPEQVSGWLKKQAGPSISHEWIYQHILADKRSGGEFYKHLRCQKKHRKRYGSPERRGRFACRIGSVLKSDPKWKTNANGWETGKSIPWLAKTNRAPW